MAEHRRDLTAIFKVWIAFVVSLSAAYAAFACGMDNGAGSNSWQCEVTLTLVPSRVGGLSSPSGSGKGTGTGATQDEALRAALRTACSQLGLSGNAKSRCESGQEFDVRNTVNGVTLISAVDRSQRCGTN